MKRYQNANHETVLDRMRAESEQRERDETWDAITKAGGNLAEAARLVGISRGGMIYRAKKYGLMEPPKETT